MTQIPNSNLYIEVVPIEAYNIKTDNFLGNNIQYDLPYVIIRYKINLPDENQFEIVGTVTETEIDFDCEPYVEMEFDTYRDYTHDEEIGSYVLNTSQDSFRSLLEANGFYWVNPLGKKPSKAQSLVGAWELLVADSINSTISKLRLEQWRDAESKKLKTNDKLVILKQII